MSHLHVVAGRTEPLKEKDGKNGHLNADEEDHHPRDDIEWLWKKWKSISKSQFKVDKHTEKGFR